MCENATNDVVCEIDEIDEIDESVNTVDEDVNEK